MTPFQSPDGVELDIRNLAYRLEPRNGSVKADYNKRYKWATPDGSKESANLSGIFIATFTPKTILVPGPQGNAGSFERNAYKIRIGIAAPNIRAITGLSNLLEQNIAPATYTTVLTLTAYADPN